jgi:hypothetical protein
MDDYHSQEAFESRMAERRSNPKPLFPVAVFYHISCMPGWEPVVSEQLSLLSTVGLKKIKSCIIASETDYLKCLRMASYYGVQIDVLDRSTDMGLYEGPTLNSVFDWACNNIDGAVFYLHTKGVSNPADKHKRQWRRVMQKHVIVDWQQNLNYLQAADLLGCAWQESRDFPHFCGNFWAARCDWLAHLQRPDRYRLSRPDFYWAGVHSWRNRMYVETWLGSKGWHHVEDRIGKGTPLWNDHVYTLETGVEGFDYNAPFYLGDDISLGTAPFRWWMIDNFTKDYPLELLPPSDSAVWEARYENDVEQHKRTSRKIGEFQGLSEILNRLRSPESIHQWGSRLGYTVEDDPHMHGGGVQVTEPGGWLNTHLDYDLHPWIPGRRRALNLVVFLNPKWEEEWGGALCLCDPLGNVRKRIYPAPGRLVAFEVGDLSYHSVEQVTGPYQRLTVALSFLSPAGPHNTRQRALFIPNRVSGRLKAV